MSSVGTSGVPPQQGQRGLYGSRIGERLVRSGAAEFTGTALLVFIGTTAAVASGTGADYDPLAVALAFGFTLVALAAAFGHVSGCHLNPAVTLGLAVSKRFPWPAAGAYVAAQLAGGVVGAAATWLCYGTRGRDVANLGATKPADFVPEWRAFLVELLITFLLVLVVIAVATDDRAESGIAPLAVGVALSAAILAGGPLTGGAVNPARAFGPNLLGGEIGPLWIYLLAPVVGGILAALLYARVFARTDPPA
jgi:glycerol uptake facilitator protein/aquaporin Z/aquaporin NIP